MTTRTKNTRVNTERYATATEANERQAELAEIGITDMVCVREWNATEQANVYVLTWKR